MRFGRKRKERKTVKFFNTCFGFRQPYKVLCDGTFVHHLLTKDIMPADKALADLLGGTAKLFTTSCVIRELEHLGSEAHKKNKKKNDGRDASSIENPYIESFKAARKLAEARCDHEKRISADACIKEIVGADNPEHFYVATQDAEFREKLQGIPGVPLIYGLNKALLLERPSKFQKDYAEAMERKRLHMTKSEQNLLRKRVKSADAEDSDENSSDNDLAEDSAAKENLEDNPAIQQAVQKVKHKGMELGVSDKPLFKRKKAKGPNPLSCKKKKSQDKQGKDTKKESKDASETTISTGARKRNRSRKGKPAAESKS